MKRFASLVSIVLAAGLNVVRPVLAANGSTGSATAAATNPLKTLDYGTFKGIYDPRTNTDSWLGMPFAVGGRLQNPTVIGADNRLNGVQDATQYGPACPQTEVIASPLSAENAEVGAVLAILEEIAFQPISHQAEDCLSINVQIPHGLNSTAGLPVLMWIFGGGYELGSSAALGLELTAVEGVIYQGANLVARSVEMGQPIVFVSANYRLNTFGGLASQEMTDAGLSNLILKDQRVAMQWVQKYISMFGGEASKVTLMGESAGSMSIATQMVLNDGDPEGLFRGAIMLSGGPSKWSNYTRGQPAFDQMMRSIGCGSAADKIACFRAAPYDTIFTALQEFPNFFSYESTIVPWYPRPDGEYLAASPDVLVREGKVADIPFIIGDMKDEGTIFSLVNQLNVTTDADFIEYFATVFFPEADRAHVEHLCSLYSQDPAQGSPFDTGDLNQLGPQYKRLAALVGDYTFQASRRDLLAHVAGRQNAWSYQIEDSIPLLGQVPVIGPSAVAGLPVVGSFHVSDVSLYVFGTIPPALSKNSLNLMSTFIAFTNNLDPNTHGVPDLPTWPQYNNANKTLLRFREAGPDLIPDTYREEQMAYINANPDQFRS